MGNKNLNVPKGWDESSLKNLYTGSKDLLAPIASAKTLNAMPGPVQELAGLVLNTPKPQDIIRQFLYRAPSVPEASPEKKLTMPAPPAKMQALGGNVMDGSSIYHRLEIKNKKWTDFSGITKGYPDMNFDTVLIRTRQHKKIVETDIQGSDDGSVFEYSGLSNYDVELNIVVTKNENGVYPQTEVDNLVKMCEAQVSVEVSSWYLQTLSITELVLLDYDISQDQGGISQQVVIIQAKSNKRATLIIQ